MGVRGPFIRSGIKEPYQGGNEGVNMGDDEGIPLLGGKNREISLVE